jgi:predicted chitinase
MMRMTKNELIVKNELIAAGFSKESTAAVMGVVGGESAFTTLKETSYVNTSNSRIRAIFPVRLGKMSDEQLNALKKDYNAFYDTVYGGMYGNASNEGAKYVGRGFNGITFKANYELAAKATGIDFVNQPELLEKPEFAAKALAYYFRNIKHINDFETAFREAYRTNAGIGKSFEFYAASTNPVHVQGIPRKRNKGLEYLKFM